MEWWSEVEERFREKFVIGTTRGLSVSMKEGAIHDFEMQKVLSFFHKEIQERLHEDSVDSELPK